MIFASLKELETQGWTRATGISGRETYPASGAVVVEKDGYFLEHTYAVREDDSDWPGDDCAVSWETVEVYEEVRRYTRRARVAKPAPFDEQEVMRRRREARAAAEDERQRLAEKRERAEYDRLHAKFGSSGTVGRDPSAKGAGG